MESILVVEDAPAVREMLLKLLELEGFSAVGVGSGSEAVALLEREPFDLVLLDLMLGESSGYDVLREMERNGHRERTRVLVLTARASEPDIVQGWRHGVDEYRTKPFDTSDLLDAVRETLHRSPDELSAFREAQRGRAELFSSLEAVFDEGASP
jgi:DNA-binding response OmpR family regulator